MRRYGGVGLPGAWRPRAAIRAAGTLIAIVLLSPAALAQSVSRPAPAATRPTGRVSFYTSAIRIAPDNAAAVSSADFITAVQLAVPDSEASGLDYGIDMRQTRSAGSARPARVSVYDGYVGARLAHGRVRARVGQMWLADLGGLGSVAGAQFEVRRAIDAVGRTRVRIGGFAGLEPEPFGLGHASGVRKLGVYATVDAAGGRRHTAGYIRVTQGGLVERSVLTTSNFVRGGTRVFLFQTAEYDLAGPGGQGKGRLTYLMTNVHASAGDHLELQGLYHRGRSLDARAITDDILNSRPLRPDALTGLLFESAGGRVVYRVGRDMRLNAGYTRDRNNMDSAATGRATAGGSIANLARAGVDLTVSASRIDRPTGQYTSFYLSAGRQAGSLVYLTGEYSSAVSIARFTRSDGVTIETRPHTRQAAISGIITLSRSLSVLVTADRTRDEGVTDVRLLSGLTVRMR